MRLKQLIIKKTDRIIVFAVPADHSKNQRRRIKRLLGPCKRTKKAVEHKGDSDTICSRCTWNGS